MASRNFTGEGTISFPALIAISLLFFSSDVISRARATTPNIRDIFIGRCYDYNEIGPGRLFNPELIAISLLFFSSDVISRARATTPNIRDIFIGRCYDYNEIGPGRLFNPEPRDCEAIWNAFVSAWSFKDPRNITQNDYQDFFNLTRQTNIPENKTLLWSGTYDIAHAYANGGKRYVTLEDTLIGYLANGLTWCGIKCQGCPGINYDKCPDYQDLPIPARQAFWGGASSTFAESAQGLVSIMVNGTKPNNKPAFNNHSFMALFELPDLNQHVNIRVVLVNDLDKHTMEHCDSGSMVSMRRAIESHGFPYVCVENPEDVLLLMCVDHPYNKNCLLPTGGGQHLSAKHGLVLSVSVFIVYLGF